MARLIEPRPADGDRLFDATDDAITALKRTLADAGLNRTDVEMLGDQEHGGLDLAREMITALRVAQAVSDGDTIEIHRPTTQEWMPAGPVQVRRLKGSGILAGPPDEADPELLEEYTHWQQLCPGHLVIVRPDRIIVRQDPATLHTRQLYVHLDKHWLYLANTVRVRSLAPDSMQVDLRASGGDWSDPGTYRPETDALNGHPIGVVARLSAKLVVGSTLDILYQGDEVEELEPVTVVITDEWQHVLPGIRVRQERDLRDPQPHTLQVWHPHSTEPSNAATIGLPKAGEWTDSLFFRGSDDWRIFTRDETAEYRADHQTGMYQFRPTQQR